VPSSIIDNKKLTIYKLSIEDYDVFRVLTNIVYQHKQINRDSPSEMLRFIVTPVIYGSSKTARVFTFASLGKTKFGRTSSVYQ
jgi:hypothetical protein